MALTFIQGTMASSKSAALLMFRNHLPENSTSIKIAIPFLGNEKTHIETRAPLSSIKIDFTIKKGDSSWLKEINEGVKFLLIDECQFLDSGSIFLLKNLSRDVCIICYGLLHDFQHNLFEGARILTEVSDKIINIPSPCKLCLENLAECNMRESNGKMILDGPLVVLKGEINYIPVCRYCYAIKKQEASQ